MLLQKHDEATDAASANSSTVTPLCPQCHATTQVIGSCDDYMQHAATVEDERKHISAYMAAHRVSFDSFVECTACGLISITPMPSGETLAHFYQNYYGSRGYANKGPKKIARTRKRLQKLRRYVQGGTFLDIGCNLGFSVEAARLEGFDATGIEIDANAIAQAKSAFPQNHFTATTIADFTPDRTFDLLYCAEVIEHVTDTAAFVTHLARLTKPGGYLFITTPDAGHWRRPGNFIEWQEVKPPEHVNWQTKRSLHQLLTAHGFAAPRFFFKFKPSLHLLARKL